MNWRDEPINQPPIEHVWFECPMCGAELETSPGGDEGPTTEYRCNNDRYRWGD